MKKLKIILLAFLFAIIPLSSVFAQSNATAPEQATAKLQSVNVSTQFVDGDSVRNIHVKALGLDGSIKGKTIEFDQSLAPTVDESFYKAGVDVYITISQQTDGTYVYGITDFVRTGDQIFLVIVFLVVLIGVAGLKGLRSVIGLVLSLLVIILFIIPNIINGTNAILTTIVGGILILLPTMYLVHGFNRKSTVAISGAIISLFLAAIISFIFTQIGRITGVGNEDALFLLLGGGSKIEAQGLFLAGVMIGTLGVLIDMTIGQASAIQEIDEANPELTSKELYKSGMNVGKDHIGSLVNTLFLAYAGVSLPIIIYLTQTKEPLLFNLSTESTAMEILRAIIGSISLILAVPITNFIGVYFAKKRIKDKITH